MSSSANLYSEFDLKGLKLKNRIVMSPMTRGRSGPDGIPGDIVVEYYRQRASAGLIITEGTSITKQARGWMGAPGIYTVEQQAAWRKVTDAVHEEGGKIFLQLWHTGRASHSSFHDGELPVAASAVKHGGEYIHAPAGKVPYDEAPRALTTEEVEEVVQDYRKAAERALAAGFDGLNIHGANGYLIDQFLQSRSNQRTDRYGGSVANRTRFLEDIVQAVTQVYPANRVAVRVSPNGIYNDMGSVDFREQFSHVIQTLSKYDLAYLDLCDGLGFGFHKHGKPFTVEEGRGLFKGILSANIGYDRDAAAAIVAAGTADLVTVGRPFLSNPDLVTRWQQNLPEAPTAPFTVWYSPGPEGYIDFPPISINENRNL